MWVDVVVGGGVRVLDGVEGPQNDRKSKTHELANESRLRAESWIAKGIAHMSQSGVAISPMSSEL